MTSQIDNEVWDHYQVEDRLLIRSINANLHEENTISKLLQQDIDWRYTVDTAYEHCVTQLLYQALKNYAQELTPNWVLDELNTQLQLIGKQNLQYTQALIELVSEIRANDIPVIPYRGPVLASIAYGNIGLRQFGDLDLLVYQSDIPAIKEILVRLGYKPRYWRESTEELTETQERLYTKYCRDYPLQNDAGIEVELHWRVVSRDFPTNIKMDTVWDRAVDVTVGGSQLAVLSPEDRLLMLLVHGSRHQWERLGWIVDVAQVLYRYEIDMKSVWERAKAQNSTRMAALGLLLVHELFDINIPNQLIEHIYDPSVNNLSIICKKNLFNHSTSDTFEAHIYQSKLLESNRQVFRFWLLWALHPERATIEMIKLPESMTKLYPLIRITRIIKLALRKLSGLD